MELLKLHDIFYHNYVHASHHDFSLVRKKIATGRGKLATTGAESAVISLGV